MRGKDVEDPKEKTANEAGVKPEKLTPQDLITFIRGNKRVGPPEPAKKDRSKAKAARKQRRK